MGKIASLIDAGMSIDNQAKARRLDAEFTDLTKKVVVLEAQIQKLEAEVNPLGRTIERHVEKICQLEEKIAHLTATPKVDFNQRTGTYVDTSGIHYCTKCDCGGNRSPLKSESYGWRCMVCTKYFPDPSRPEPSPNIPLYRPSDDGIGL